MSEQYKQKDIERDIYDYKIGRLHFYAAVVNLFCGFYTEIIMFISNYINSKWLLKHKYIKITFLVFCIYFFSVYAIIFYSINKSEHEDLLNSVIDFVIWSIFLSIIVSFLNLINFMIKFIKFKLNLRK